jgi:cysteine desulfurase
MKPVYLDHHATTPCDEEVVQAMLPWFTERFGNAGSRHAWGAESSAGLNLAREQVAALVHGEADEVVFTSGATEANHLALLGAAATTTKKRHVVTVASEHKAVLEPLHRLEAQGWEVTTLLPDPDGLLPPERLAAALRDDTHLVSVMWVNNEIGTIQPIRALADVAHARGALLHTDASQAVGHVPVNLPASGADLATWTAHKLYGPKGVGALWIRPGHPRVKLEALQVGGGQERGLRAGTLPVPLIVGFGAASAIGGRWLVGDGPRMLAFLRDTLWDGLRRLPGTSVNGSLTHRHPGNLNVAFDGCRASELLTLTRTVAISSGSACSQAEPKPSHVLTALGHDAARASSSLRFGLGRGTTPRDVSIAIDALRCALLDLRRRK